MFSIKKLPGLARLDVRKNCGCLKCAENPNKIMIVEILVVAMENGHIMCVFFSKLVSLILLSSFIFQVRNVDQLQYTTSQTKKFGHG